MPPAAVGVAIFVLRWHSVLPQYVAVSITSCNLSSNILIAVRAVAFDIIDVNKSGSLDRDEMGSFLKCLIQVVLRDVATI